jgi:D-sedoheptulose 7-phosphate isomerase
MDARIDRLLEEARAVSEELAGSEELKASVAAAARAIVKALREGRKVLLCGNGGSAADCQHVAAELVGRFRREREGMSAVALTTDTSVLTSVSNDYGFAEAFRRQVEALGKKGDVLVAYSTSGNAENVLRAVDEAKSRGLVTVGMTGADGGRLAGAVDIVVRAPTEPTFRVQECHLVIDHALCELVESALADPDGGEGS